MTVALTEQIVNLKKQYANSNEIFENIEKNMSQ